MNNSNVPDVTFHTRHKDEFGNFEWKDVTTYDIFHGRKVIVFALPGAFTPTCTSKHLPRYEELYDELRNYCDEIYCLSVNDSFVMNAWFKQLNIQKVKPIPDGNADFTIQTGMERHHRNLGFGVRSHRYSAFVNNGVISVVFSEDRAANGDPYEVSDADTMLNWLKDHE